MRNARGARLRRFLIVAGLVCGGWFSYRHGWLQINLQRFSGHLENAVNQELSRLGITDRDVVSQINKEHGGWIFTWVETQRALRVPSEKRALEISRALESVARDSGCSVESSVSPTGLTIRIKKFLVVLQRLSLDVSQTPAPHPNMPQVAFVIDDVAYETVSMDHFASLGVPLTFAILPREKHTRQLAEKAKSMNFPVMLHLPMEPLDLAHNDPGPTGLYLKMTDQELKNQFDKNVASVPYLVGINNHMGSAFTENDPKMTLVLEWVKKRGVYFLDSRTSIHSVVCKAAKRVGVPCLANETFLDNKDDVKSIEDQLDLVMKLALREGKTIAIGHYRRKFLVQALANKIPEFKARGVQIVALPSFYHK